MLRESTGRTFYDIQPGNRVGLFFQPQSLHGTYGNVKVNPLNSYGV